jgi:hypothetical protein
MNDANARKPRMEPTKGVGGPFVIVPDWLVSEEAFRNVSLGAKLLYGVFLSCKLTGWPIPTWEKLAERMGVSKRQIGYWVDELKKSSLLSTERSSGWPRRPLYTIYQPADLPTTIEGEAEDNDDVWTDQFDQGSAEASETAPASAKSAPQQVPQLVKDSSPQVPRLVKDSSPTVVKNTSPRTTSYREDIYTPRISSNEEIHPPRGGSDQSAVADDLEGRTRRDPSQPKRKEERVESTPKAGRKEAHPSTPLPPSSPPEERVLEGEELHEAVFRVMGGERKEPAPKEAPKEAPKKASKRKAPADDPARMLPDDLAVLPGMAEAWRDWVEHRKQKRTPLTQVAIQRQIEFLRKQPDPVAVVEQSLVSGWTGLFPLKGGAQPRKPEPEPEHPKEERYLLPESDEEWEEMERLWGWKRPKSSGGS